MPRLTKASRVELLDKAAIAIATLIEVEISKGLARTEILADLPDGHCPPAPPGVPFRFIAITHRGAPDHKAYIDLQIDRDGSVALGGPDPEGIDEDGTWCFIGSGAPLADEHNKTRAILHAAWRQAQAEPSAPAMKP